MSVKQDVCHIMERYQTLFPKFTAQVPLRKPNVLGYIVFVHTITSLCTISYVMHGLSSWNDKISRHIVSSNSCKGY